MHVGAQLCSSLDTLTAEVKDRSWLLRSSLEETMELKADKKNCDRYYKSEKNQTQPKDIVQAYY